MNERWLNIFNSDREVCDLCGHTGRMARSIITPLWHVNEEGKQIPTHTLEVKKCYECFKDKGD